MERLDEVADVLARTLKTLRSQNASGDPARSAKIASLEINLLAVSLPGNSVNHFN
jgi:hypothetical protein